MPLQIDAPTLNSARIAAARAFHPHQPWDGPASWWLREQAAAGVDAVVALLDERVDERARIAEDARRFAESELEKARAELAAERARALDLERQLRRLTRTTDAGSSTAPRKRG